MPDDERKPIEAPTKVPARKLARDVTEALVDGVPFAGPVLTAVLRNTHPPVEEKDRERWEGEVTQETNRLSGTVDEHDRLLRPQVETITGLAATLAAFLVQMPHDGLPRSYMLNKMAPEVPGAPTPSALIEAADELSMLSLVEVKRYLGGGASVRSVAALFEQLDPQIMGWNPMEDAQRLAALLLEDESRCAVARLHAASGWEKRRFNPAMQHLLRFFESGHISGEIQPDYPTNQILLIGASKVRLRRFAGAAGPGEGLAQP